MSSPNSDRLSLGDTVSLIQKFCWILSYQFYQSIAVVFRDKSSSRSYSHERRNRVSHVLCEWLSSKQLRTLFKPTRNVFALISKERSFQWHDEDIPDGLGSKLHWVGHAGADRLIFYLHGGGYNLPANDGHLKFLVSCQQMLADAGYPTSAAILEYGLTPEARYPTQPKQAIAALRHILEKGFRPSNIVIMGDSAGGNLTLAVLSIINHPAELFPVLDLEEPFRGVCLISPWVSFSTQSPSYHENASKDLVNARLILEWADAYAPSPLRDEYSEPLRADLSWWKGTPTLHILNLAGSIELFRDDIEELGKRISQAGVTIETITCPNHAHEECIQDAIAGLDSGLMARSVWTWLTARFS